MTSTRPVQAVIFDWGGTMTPWHDIDVRAPWDAFARGYGTMACALTELSSRILAAEDDAWRRSRQEHTSARLAEILRVAGVDVQTPAALAGLAAYEEFWEPHTLTHPAIPALLAWLRTEEIKVGVLSNTIWSRQTHERIFARDGVLKLIDGAVYSSETDWVKPHPQIFHAAARAVGVDPTRCVFVGDRSFEDVYGPQQVGMRAILVPHSRIPEYQQVSHQATPDAIAADIDDVRAIIATWQGDR